MCRCWAEKPRKPSSNTLRSTDTFGEKPQSTPKLSVVTVRALFQTGQELYDELDESHRNTCPPTLSVRNLASTEYVGDADTEKKALVFSSFSSKNSRELLIQATWGLEILRVSVSPSS